MQSFPHRYRAGAEAERDSEIRVTSPGLEDLVSAPPAEFGGPGDRWSPETLLVAAVADCFILTFRAIARASKLDWIRLECDTEGVLERPDRTTRFTRFVLRTKLAIPEETDPDRARRLLEKAEQTCLITNSMTSEVSLETEVTVESGVTAS